MTQTVTIMPIQSWLPRLQLDNNTTMANSKALQHSHDDRLTLPPVRMQYGRFNEPPRRDSPLTLPPIRLQYQTDTNSQERRNGYSTVLVDDNNATENRPEHIAQRYYIPYDSEPSQTSPKGVRDARSMNPPNTVPSNNDVNNMHNYGNDLRKRPSSGELPGLPRKEPRTGSSLMPISDLVSPDYISIKPKPPKPKFSYDLTMRQQPVSARACGFGDRDRRVIDPPPILELKISSEFATPEELHTQLRKQYYVCHCSLWSADYDVDNSAMDDPSSSSRTQQRRLMGTLVASPFVGKDEFGVEGCFFCFPDLSCRTTGRYRLRFSLVLLDPARMRPGNKEPFLALCTSDVVTVYAAKDFPGMQSSTALTRKLKEQGCLISVKKGIEKIGDKGKSKAAISAAVTAAAVASGPPIDGNGEIAAMSDDET